MYEEKKSYLGLKIFAGIVAFVALLFVASSITTIDQGERGLVTRFGKVVKVVEPGMQWIGIFNKVIPFQTRNAKYDAKADAGTVDQQRVLIDVSVNYEIDPAAIKDIYATFGQDYINRIFKQNVQESVKSASAQYKASELLRNRAQFKADVIKNLNATVNKYVIVTDVTINDLGFSEDYDKAIEEKVRAEQQAETAKNILDAKRFEAEAIRIQAEAIKTSGGAEYVQLKAIEKWDGVLPATMAQGSVPFLNLK